MHRRPLPSPPLTCPRPPASRSGRVVGLALVAASAVAALASSTAASAAAPAVAATSAGAPAPASASPLILDVIRRASRAAASAATATAPAPTVNGAPTGFGAPSMNAMRTLPTALSNLHATVAPPTANRTRALTAPTNPYAAQSKHPGTEGFAGDQFGHALTTAGDMNGDGVSDVAVGAFQALGPAGMTGEVIYYYGTPSLSTPPTNIYGEQVFDEFGYSVAGVGDVNGDGYPDLLVGAPLHDVGANVDAGKAYLYLGGPAGIATAPRWVFSPGEAHARVGWSVAWAGDVNNDGYDDWIVGAPGHSNGESAEGAAYLFLGGPGLLSNVPAWSYEPNVANAEFGSCVATAGDVNGDGYADLVIGAPYLTDSFTNEGKAYLFFGHSTKPSLVPDAFWEGGQPSTYFGFSVAAAGDVDGDGYGDMIIGAPYYDDPTVNQGLAKVVYGGPNPLLFRTPDDLKYDQLNGYFGMVGEHRGRRERRRLRRRHRRRGWRAANREPGRGFHLRGLALRHRLRTSTTAS